MRSEPLSLPRTLPGLAVRAPTRPRAAAGLTPLIDVVFILLLFFMLATSFGQWRFLEILAGPPPSARPAPALQGQTILVSLRPGEVLLSGRRLSYEWLGDAIAELSARRPRIEHIIVDVADPVPLQRLVDLLELFRSTGLPTPILRSTAPTGGNP